VPLTAHIALDNGAGVALPSAPYLAARAIRRHENGGSGGIGGRQQQESIRQSAAARRGGNNEKRNIGIVMAALA